MTLAEVIYLLCTATSLVAAALLTRQYLRRRTPLLFWSSVAFAGFSVNNVLVYIDLAVLPEADLALLRSLIAAAAMLSLVYGLTKEAR